MTKHLLWPGEYTSPDFLLTGGSLIHVVLITLVFRGARGIGIANATCVGGPSSSGAAWK